MGSSVWTSVIESKAPGALADELYMEAARAKNPSVIRPLPFQSWIREADCKS